jgi:hypothetical protein
VSSGLLVIVGLLGPVVLGRSVWAEWATCMGQIVGSRSKATIELL